MAGSSSHNPHATGLRILARLIARAERNHSDIEERGSKEREGDSEAGGLTKEKSEHENCSC